MHSTALTDCLVGGGESSLALAVNRFRPLGAPRYDSHGRGRKCFPVGLAESTPMAGEGGVCLTGFWVFLPAVRCGFFFFSFHRGDTDYIRLTRVYGGITCPVTYGRRGNGTAAAPVCWAAWIWVGLVTLAGGIRYAVVSGFAFASLISFWSAWTF